MGENAWGMEATHRSLSSNSFLDHRRFLAQGIRKTAAPVFSRRHGGVLILFFIILFAICEAQQTAE